MTFNLRYAHATPPNLWPDRRPVVREVIERWRPEVIGTQEGLYSQLVDMAEDLPAYRWIGIGREGGSRGEFMAVFYRHERLEPLAYDHYWLSDAPDRIGSQTWGNRYPRMVTSVRFRDRVSGQTFVLINTHLDHEVQRSRELAAELIVRRAAAWDSTEPVILVGDFNAPARANRVYDLLTAQGRFDDTWQTLGRPDTLATYHDFKGVEAARGGRRIDWILVRGPVRAVSSEIVTDARGGQYPSDHFPVIARLTLYGAATTPVAAPGSHPAPGDDVARLAWLAGCWERRSRTSTVVEQWGRPRGGTMLGTSQTVRGDSTVEFEYVRIHRGAADTLIYAATPSGQQPAAFTATEITDTSAVFENPRHDFPQRILYRRRGADSLIARIEGFRGGARRAVDFPYRRIACP